MYIWEIIARKSTHIFSLSPLPLVIEKERLTIALCLSPTTLKYRQKLKIQSPKALKLTIQIYSSENK